MYFFIRLVINEVTLKWLSTLAGNKLSCALFCQRIGTTGFCLTMAGGNEAHLDILDGHDGAGEVHVRVDLDDHCVHPVRKDILEILSEETGIQ